MTVSSITEPTRRLVEMSRDSVTRIIGNLGIYTKIDFDNREVVECKSTSSFPWIQRVHARKGPARLALHHQSHLRHLR